MHPICVAMNERENNIQKALLQEADRLRAKLLQLEDEQTSLINELDMAEKALRLFKQKTRSASFPEGRPLGEQILYCLHHQQQIMSVSSLADVLGRRAPELKSNAHLADNVRLQLSKLMRDGSVVQYKMDQMKHIHYALTGWTDAIGEVRQRFL